MSKHKNTVDETKLDNVVEKTEEIEESVVTEEESTNVETENKITEEIVTEESDENKETDEVENVAENSEDEEISDDVEEHVVEEVEHIDSAEQKICKIVIATPTYFVINKDGVNITVYEKNTYRRGETVLY
jgi:hypothetical protein